MKLPKMMGCVLCVSVCAFGCEKRTNALSAANESIDKTNVAAENKSKAMTEKEKAMMRFRQVMFAAWKSECAERKNFSQEKFVAEVCQNWFDEKSEKLRSLQKEIQDNHNFWRTEGYFAIPEYIGSKFEASEGMTGFLLESMRYFPGCIYYYDKDKCKLDFRISDSEDGLYVAKDEKTRTEIGVTFYALGVAKSNPYRRMRKGDALPNGWYEISADTRRVFSYANIFGTEWRKSYIIKMFNDDGSIEEKTVTKDEYLKMYNVEYVEKWWKNKMGLEWKYVKEIWLYSDMKVEGEKMRKE